MADATTHKYTRIPGMVPTGNAALAVEPPPPPVVWEAGAAVPLAVPDGDAVPLAVPECGVDDGACGPTVKEETGNPAILQVVS